MAHVIIKFLELEECGGWMDYFQMLSAESTLMNMNKTYNEARKPENRALNRYRDILPYDSTLVRISGTCNYINANFVSYLPANRRYILTQGPLPNTISHFWKMVWEQNCKTVIMLNKLVEKGRPKCSQYFPVEFHSDGEKYEGDLSSMLLNDVLMKLVLIREIRFESFIKRQIAVTHIPSGETREICHLNYTDWPDFGEPSTSLNFLRFLDYVRSSNAFRSSDEPPIIHCSAGVGRSGTFVYVDIVLSLLSLTSSREDVDMRDLLLNLREQRMALVQTPEQLRFSFLAIIDAIGCPEFADILPSWKNEIIAIFSNTFNNHPDLVRQFGHRMTVSKTSNITALDETLLSDFIPDEGLKRYPSSTDNSVEMEVKCVVMKLLSHFEDVENDYAEFYPFVENRHENTNVCRRFIPVHKGCPFPSLYIEVQCYKDHCVLLKLKYIESAFDAAGYCVYSDAADSHDDDGAICNPSSCHEETANDDKSDSSFSDSSMESSDVPARSSLSHSSTVSVSDVGIITNNDTVSSSVNFSNSDTCDSNTDHHTVAVKKFCMDEKQSELVDTNGLSTKKAFLIPFQITSSKVNIDNSDFLLPDGSTFDACSSSKQSVKLPVPNEIYSRDSETTTDLFSNRNNSKVMNVCNSSQIINVPSGTDNNACTIHEGPLDLSSNDCSFEHTGL